MEMGKQNKIQNKIILWASPNRRWENYVVQGEDNQRSVEDMLHNVTIII